MKKSFLLAAACGAAIIAGHAAAQTAPDGTATQSGSASAQDGAPGDNGAGNDVVVTGYRASLQSAAAQKRDSDAILDAIVAEDIGKLPDNNAAEAIARITGVQVERSGDDTTGVLIRGLPDVATTFDGREIFTAENRSVALRDFPAGALAGLEVYKSGTANIIEAGLAGLINVRSRKPFDFDGLEIAGVVRGTYNDQSRKIDPNGNLLISNRWETGIGEIGALVNFAYVQQQYLNTVRYAEASVDGPDGTQPVLPASVGRNFKFPTSAGLYYSGGKRVRPSINGTIQWKPNPDLEVYAQGLWQAYRGDNGDDQFVLPLRNGTQTLSNVVLEANDPTKVASFTATGGTNFPVTKRSQNRDYTNTYQGAFGFIWETGRAKISNDFAYTFTEYGSKNSKFETQFNGPVTADVEFNRKNGAAFDISGVDATNPSTYNLIYYDENRYYVTGSGIQWRGDIELETDLPFVKTIQFGGRVTSRDATKRQGYRAINLYGYSGTLPSIAGLQGADFQMIPNGFRGNVQPFASFLSPTRSNLRANAKNIRSYMLPYLQQMVAANPGDSDRARFVSSFNTFDSVQFDRGNGFRGNEQSYGVYGQVKYEFDVGYPVDGLIGVRVVNTVGQHTGIDGVNSDDLVQNYVDVLPNVSMRLKFTPEVQLRLGFTETRTRVNFDRLTPSYNLTPASPADKANPSPNLRFDYDLSSGNPNLRPLTSKNFDASLEYYFSKNGSASVSVFYRDLFGFVTNLTSYFDDANLGRVRLNRPENAGDGELKGVEAAFQTFFDFLPGALSGLGVQANVTYLDGKNQLPSSNGTPSQLATITGISKWTYNLTGLYEKGPISARLSYNRRSDFVNEYGRNADETKFRGVLTRPLSRLDFSLSYTPFEALTLTADVNNILAQPFENYRYYTETQSYPRDIRDEGRYFGLGARFRL